MMKGFLYQIYKHKNATLIVAQGEIISRRNRREINKTFQINGENVTH